MISVVDRVPEAEQLRRDTGWTWKQIAHELGVNYHSLRRARSEARTHAETPPSPDNIIPMPPTFDESSGEIRASDGEFRTLDDLLAACAIDLDQWEVQWQTLSTSHGAHWVRLKRKVADVVQDGFATMLDLLKDGARKYPKPRQIAPVGHYLLVLHAYDVHFGKRNLDRVALEDVAAEFRAVCDTLLGKALALHKPISQILIPLGHDALHVDTMQHTTTRGTPQETSADPRLAAEVALRSFICLIERAAEIAPVRVQVIPGNHDQLAGYQLGLGVQMFFDKHPRVTVHCDRKPRQYFTWGNTLLGMTHGDIKSPEKTLPELMSLEAAESWGQTRYRKWMMGHKHQPELHQSHGVTIQRYPALSRLDRWHDEHGYVGNHRAAVGELIHHDHGPEVLYTVFTDEVAAMLEQPTALEAAA